MITYELELSADATFGRSVSTFPEFMPKEILTGVLSHESSALLDRVVVLDYSGEDDLLDVCLQAGTQGFHELLELLLLALSGIGLADVDTDFFSDVECEPKHLHGRVSVVEFLLELVTLLVHDLGLLDKHTENHGIHDSVDDVEAHTEDDLHVGARVDFD